MRLRLIATPSARTTIDTRFARLDTKSGASWYAPVPPGASGDTPRPFIGDFPSNAARTLTDASVKADVRFDAVKLTSVSAFSRVTARLDGDVDFLPIDGSTGGQALRTDTLSQELRLTSNGAGAFEWLAGLYFLNTHERLDTQIFLRTAFLPLFGLPATLSPFPVSATRTTDSNDAYAAFGQASYRWPTNIELTAALRYDEDHRHQLDRSAPTPAVYEHAFDSLQPKVSLSWRIERDRMVYARPVAALELGAALGFTKSRIERYDPSVFAGLPVAGDFTGNELPQTPQYSYSAYTQYRVAFRGGLALTPRLELQGCGGDYFWEIEIDNANKRAPQTFVNVRLTAERAAWSLSAFLENALDEQYVVEFLPAQWSGVAAGDVAAAGRGRHWGIEARYRF